MTTNTPPPDNSKPSNTSKTTAKGAAKEAKEDARKLAKEVTAEGVSYAKDAKASAISYADEAKKDVAREGQNVALALRNAADEMRNGSPQERTLGQIADGIADASDAIRDKDLGQIVGDLNAFARRNPTVFLTGAALVGFAAVRFAKASKPGAGGSSQNRAQSMSSFPGSRQSTSPREAGAISPASAPQPITRGQS